MSTYHHRACHEYVVLLPLQKTSNLNKFSIERRIQINTEDKNILHIGDGSNANFVIYKYNQSSEQETEPIRFSYEFKVVLTDRQTKETHVENRILNFWFYNLQQHQYVSDAHQFLHTLLKSDEFPRDYFSFIKRLMELLRLFSNVRKLELEIRILIGNNHTVDENSVQSYSGLLKKQLLDLLEQAFPNSMFVNDLTKYIQCDESIVFQCLLELESQNLVKHLDFDGQQWIRVIISIEEENLHKVILYKSVEEMSHALCPTIAIVTVNYFEKLAVDAMIENKITFVRHKAGESNVYTIGSIGVHRVVATKLSLIGRSRTARISTGSTTTRLLGTFQHIQHVFIIGCAGGIPDYADTKKHIKRGDIVVGYPNKVDYVYGIYEAEKSVDGYEFVSTCFKPKHFQLYKILESIKENYHRTNKNRTITHKYPWERFLQQGIECLLSHNVDCLPPLNDKIFMRMESNELINIKHRNKEMQDYLKPTVHFGMIAGGKYILTNDYLKIALSDKFNVLCFDSEIDQVLAAIQGNRIESFMIIRGISDYYDGTLGKEWQPYASLCAAAFMKAIINRIPNDLYTHSNSSDNNNDEDFSILK